MTSKRAIFACDVADLWDSCRAMYGQKARIDFASVRHAAFDIVEEFHEFKAYIITHPKATHHKFEEKLGELGFSVEKFELEFIDNIKGPVVGSWQSGLFFELLSKVDLFEDLVLAVGESNYKPLVKYLENLGKNVVVLTFPTPKSISLYSDMPNNIVDLDKTNVYIKKGRS